MTTTPISPENWALLSRVTLDDPTFADMADAVLDPAVLERRAELHDELFRILAWMLTIGPELSNLMVLINTDIDESAARMAEEAGDDYDPHLPQILSAATGQARIYSFLADIRAQVDRVLLGARYPVAPTSVIEDIEEARTE